MQFRLVKKNPITVNNVILMVGVKMSDMTAYIFNDTWI